MGYTTEFEGAFELVGELSPKLKAEINIFCEEDHRRGNYPGIWCDWRIRSVGDKNFLAWNGAEKFYNYTEWLQYLINIYFKPNNISVNGDVKYFGEDHYDCGMISVKDNVISLKKGELSYKEIQWTN